MGVEVKTVQTDDEVNKPVKDDTIDLWYRNYLFAKQTPENKSDM